MRRQVGCKTLAVFDAFVGLKEEAHLSRACRPVMLPLEYYIWQQVLVPQDNLCCTALPGCSCALSPPVMMLQVYGVCRGPVDQAGAIKVISPARRVDTLMSTDADFEGITGLWSMPAEPSGGSHVLVVLSFLAGSRALTAGAVDSPSILAVPALGMVACPWP